MSANDLQISYPKVLIITRNGWNSNCTGNTLSNFFEGWPKEKIANAFFRAENIDNNVCTEYYKVTEYELVKKFFCKKNNKIYIKKFMPSWILKLKMLITISHFHGKYHGDNVRKRNIEQTFLLLSPFQKEKKDK